MPIIARVASGFHVPTARARISQGATADALGTDEHTVEIEKNRFDGGTHTLVSEGLEGHAAGVVSANGAAC
jgi:hypothetical protein